jgi:hypothetical protein
MVTFYYEIGKLIDRAEVEALLYVKSLKNEDGLPALEELAIGDEDESYIRKLLYNVANQVYAKLSPYSRGLASLEVPLEGFEFDKTYTDDDEAETETENCIIFRILEPDNFDEVVRLPLDNTIENIMINYVVSEWLFRNAADGSIHKERYEKNLDEILKYINRRLALKRTYKLY